MKKYYMYRNFPENQEIPREHIDKEKDRQQWNRNCNGSVSKTKLFDTNFMQIVV